ncbi:MAG: hypothetical protein ACOYOF_19780 [Verrucomicrobiaceae bacterium]
MIVVLDTNALIQVLGRASPNAPIREALLRGRLHLAASTPILLEYEEVTSATQAPRAGRMCGPSSPSSAGSTAAFTTSARATVFTPSRAIPMTMPLPTAPSSLAQHLITSDHHFDVLIGSGDKPQPITPQVFIARHLAGNTAPKSSPEL